LKVADPRVLIVIPTYNERDNVANILEAIWKTVPYADVLIVDDNSPDGTGDLADKSAEASGGRLRVLHRSCKNGLGRAYIDGFNSVLDENYEFLFQMDADLSHEPCYIPGMIEAARHADIIVGSRYIRGVNVVNWDFKRLLLSKAATIYVNLLTGLRMSDTTSGFKCWRLPALSRLRLDKVGACGYLFQIEMNLLAIRAGLRVKEFPIVFYERELGRSKIDWHIILEAIFGTVRLAAQHRYHCMPWVAAVQARHKTASKKNLNEL
jgi:dolichol-phosphate mannosyltransferase